jgi:hypothetical protein
MRARFAAKTSPYTDPRALEQDKPMARKRFDPTPTNDALARAWKNLDTATVFDGAEHLLNTGALNAQRVDTIVGHLGSIDRSALRADLLEQAAAVEHGHGDDGDEAWGMEIFAIPVHGTGDAVGALVDDPNHREAIAQAILDHGFVHGDAAVSILWGFWTCAELARIDPQTMRQAACEAADRLDANGDAGTTPLAALAGTWSRPAGNRPTGGVLLAILGDPRVPEEGVVDPLRYMLTWGDADSVEGPDPHTVADPAAAWFDMWASVGPEKVGALEPSGMGMAAAVALEAHVQQVALGNGADPEQALCYSIHTDDRGGAIVEARLPGSDTLWAQVMVEPALFEKVAAQLLTLFDPEPDDGLEDVPDGEGCVEGPEETAGAGADAPARGGSFWGGGSSTGLSPQQLRDALAAFSPPKGSKRH